MERNKDKEREFRLRPTRPPAIGERRVYASAYKIIMHHARMSGIRRRRVAGFGGGATHARPHVQRCAVRILYSKNSSKGQWRAHGRYIARESASNEGVGFNGAEESINIALRLAGWQKANDERLWKLIVSPEFGDRVDLKRLTRDLMSEMQTDLGIPLEWVAVAHFNTEHPHVHVALRGVGTEGRQVRLSRDFIREGIRHIAEDYCTRQLGFRSERDTAESQRREVHQHRYTALDRIIQRDAESAVSTESTFFTVTKDPSRAGLGPSVSLTERHTAERLMFLVSMGLAESAGPKTWRVRRDFENVLRAMQRSVDLQKTLAAHGVLMSDNKLPINVLKLRELTPLEGRILVHGEEESSGRNYLLLEGTDERVHFIYYTPEMETARNAGGLRTNVFIRLRKLFTEGRLVLEVDEFGDAQSVLHNRLYLRETAQHLIRSGIVPPRTTVGMDGLVAIRMRSPRLLRLSNANEQRKQLNATGTGTLVASWIGGSADRRNFPREERSKPRIKTDSSSGSPVEGTRTGIRSTCCPSPETTRFFFLSCRTIISKIFIVSCSML